MSGHSKWAGIKHRKAAVDKKKGVAFSKAAKAIISAVRQGGPDPEANLKLKYAVEAAREVNMPRENIERAIKRGVGRGGHRAVRGARLRGLRARARPPSTSKS